MSELQSLIAEAFRYAISAHNSQPFRFRLRDEAVVEIWVVREFLLPYADPNQKDLLTALGALLETTRVLLSSRGFSVELGSGPEIPMQVPDKFKVCEFLITKDHRQKDELFDQLPKRFSYRGGFPKSSEILPQSLTGRDFRLIFLQDKAAKARIAKSFDQVNVDYLSNPGYLGELYSWLRFSPQNPRWSSDGLNTQSMALASYENAAARWILKPSVFRKMRQLGLAPLLVSEAPKIRSALAIVAIVGSRSDSMSVGRGFMRGWLQLTAMNLFGAPLSLLTDDPQSREGLHEEFRWAEGEVVYNVLRVGHLPPHFKPYPSARRRAEDFLQGTGA